MQPKESLSEQVDETLDQFDFQRVHHAMKAMEWRWATKNGLVVPTLGEIRAEARRLLEYVADNSYANCSIKTGGLLATKVTHGPVHELSLLFVVEQTWV